MKEYVKQPEHSAGTAGKEPQAQKQAPLGELLQAYKNNSPVQRAEAGDRGDGEGELNAMLENLKTIVMQAMRIPGPEDEKKDALELTERLRELQVIADGNNQEAKSALLEGLKEELGMAGPPPALANVPPVQRMKGWQKALIGTAAVIGIGTLLYKLYKNITNRPEEAEEDMPEDEVPGMDIPAELTAAVTGLPVAAQAARIFQNINNFNFEYVGLALPAHIGFREHAGDCKTLTWMYIAVAEIFNIPAVQREYVGEMLVNPQPIHGRPTLGNTEGATDWYFHNHYWIDVNGVLYDLLFMASPPPVSVLRTGTGIFHGIEYIIFADGRVVIEPQQAGWSYEIQGEGRVFTNVATAQAFIAAHP